MDTPREIPGPGAAGGPAAPVGQRVAAVDPLAAVREALEAAPASPPAERVAVLEEAHRVVVAELRALELG